jgi:hypothetical protein
MRTRQLAVVAGILVVVGACNFDITNSNQPTLDDLLTNPTRSKLSAAATGLFAGARGGIQGLIWRLGSMGREGINLSGNNQPDFIEPFYGPIVGGGSFGGTQWLDRYAHIRSANVYIAAVNKTTDLSTQEKAASLGMARTLKALAFMYVIETRGALGAPVDVDQPLSAPPAPWANEDAVWAYIVAQLDSAHTSLGAAGSVNFPFPVPPGFDSPTSDFGTPAKFDQFNRALAAKANVFRATAQNGCGGAPAACYTAALTALGQSFLDPSPAAYQNAANFDFGTGSGDATNALSDPLNSPVFFALAQNVTDAQFQTGGVLRDQRVIDKVVPVGPGDTLVYGGIPEIPGANKFTVFLSNGQSDDAHPIPIIKDEELILLRAEANWFGGSKTTALADIDSVRINSGKLPATALTTGSTNAAFVTELLYNRRYSLLWEQGTRWIDARRYGLIDPDGVTGAIPATSTGGHIPLVMPVPQSECDARNLQSGPWTVNANVVTCTP